MIFRVEVHASGPLCRLGPGLSGHQLASTGTGRRAVPEFTVIRVARVLVVDSDAAAAARAVIAVHSDLPVADSEPAVVGTRKY